MNKRLAQPPSQGGGAGSNPVGATQLQASDSGGQAPSATAAQRLTGDSKGTTGLGQRLATVAVCLLSFAFVSVATPFHAQQPAPAPIVAVHARTAADRQARLDDLLAAEMTRLDCTPPALWKGARPGVLPASMILKIDGTFILTTKVWTYPVPAGYWVLALCAKGL